LSHAEQNFAESSPLANTQKSEKTLRSDSEFGCR